MREPGSSRFQVIRKKALSNPVAGWLAPPVMEDPDRDYVVRLLNTVLIILIGGTLLGYLSMIRHATPLLVGGGISLLLLVELVSLFLLRKKKEKQAALTLSAGLWAAIVIVGVVSTGIANSATYGFVLVIAIASLTLGGRAGLEFAALSTVAMLGMLAGKQSGMLPGGMIPFEPLSFWALSSVILLATAGIIQLAARGQREATRRAKEGERAQAETNRELQAIRSSLEEQVRSRTEELQNLARYLQATIEVSRAATSMLDTDQLMNEAVEMIRSQFELYYAGLFLLDPAGEWAILRAGTGSAGQAMIARGHRIRFGAGMIGWSIANAQPRIASEIGQDSVRLATPELPETRSEAAFPLRARGKVIGAMTIQSVKTQAFGETEISTFQILADQLAVALENARLYSASQQALQEAQQVTRQVTGEAWQVYLSRGAELNFRYDHGQIFSMAADGSGPAGAEAGLPATPAGAETSLSLPIPVRDQVVGNVRFVKEGEWTDDEISLLSAVVEQLGIAMDSARLYDEIHRRAERERMTSEIVAKMRATNDPQAILQTAVSELRKALQADRAQLLVKRPGQGSDWQAEERPGGERRDRAE